MSPIYPDLVGKKILVTGALRGIGRALCFGLASQKAHVIFNYRKNSEEALKLQAELIEAGAIKATPPTIQPSGERFKPMASSIPWIGKGE